MKQEPPTDPAPEVEGEVVTTARSGISWAWLIPIIALVATSWLYWNNWKSQGPEITIAFASAPGVDPGKTALIYRGVKAGTVSAIHLDRELNKVVISVRLKAFAAHLAREGTDFWIEQPIISIREIAGLESIIQGNSIHARTQPGGADATNFQGLDEAPLKPLDAPDLVLKLHSSSIPFIGRGTPVFHRGVAVGTVRQKGYSSDGSPEVEAVIDQKYSDRVKSNSRFWIVPATTVSASPGSLSLDIPALEGLLDGSIAFDHFGPAGETLENQANFKLSPHEFAARAEGPPVTIEFEDGTGLRAGETRVTCLGQPVGLIETITTNPTTRRVEAVARLNHHFAPLVTADSEFTIIRPSINQNGIHGLGTLVTGPYIAFDPGKSKEPADTFAGRETRQLDLNLDLIPKVEGGTPVVLWADDLPKVDAGAPIYHHGMIAGRVVEQRTGEDGRPELLASIERKFSDKLLSNTRFWRIPAASLSVGPGVVGVQFPGLSALWQGGIAFDSFGSPGPAASENAEYQIHPNEQTASAISSPIRIVFHNGQGLLAGKTELKYLGITVGIVEKVRVVNKSVEATVRFQTGYGFLRRGGSEFAIIRPEIDLKGVHGIETMITGVYIACAPGSGADFPDSFNAVPPAEPELQNEPGFEIVLKSPSTKIDEGAPISYNNTPVGEVISKKLSNNGKQIILTARIREEHSNLVRSNSVFWDSTRVEAKIGFLKVEIDSPTLLDPSGRIAFHTPDLVGRAVKQNTVFPLQPEQPRDFSDTPVPEKSEKRRSPVFRRR